MSDSGHRRLHLSVTLASLRRCVARAWLRARVVAVLVLLRPALSALPVARVVAWLTPRSVPVRRDDALLADAAKWVDGLVYRRPFDFWGYCLRRSLILYYAATRAGYPVNLALGVRRDGEEVIGHAWLELCGEPFLERGESPEHYTVMRRLPPRAA